jgi:hypothetical protein
MACVMGVEMLSLSASISASVLGSESEAGESGCDWLSGWCSCG